MDEPEMVTLVVEGMRGRGVMDTQQIYAAVEPLFARFGRTKRDSWKAQVRETLQAFCPDCPEYERRGTGDYFVHHGRGSWECKVGDALAA